MYAKSSEKRGQIVDGARRVFLRQGFSATSMKDIIEECGISRGGLYFYFSSVDEIFVEVIRTRARTTAEMVESLMAESEDFAQLLGEYLAFQRERLLHMEKSLLRAMLEFGLTHRGEKDIEFINEQYLHTKEIMRRIMAFGARRGQLRGSPGPMAEQLMLLVEGLSVKTITAKPDESTIDEQFALVLELFVHTNAQTQQYIRQGD